ncbi:unnamed protein product [Cyclocybe aegerita]|uniref:Uncharacterized protein n=1 Tax=Cyclocybe aegerita TaxID=1973307 RepID=A0A8S0XFH5_CYCAE|nr:unnamed protein product [Cyclocybe aegerita]
MLDPVFVEAGQMRPGSWPSLGKVHKFHARPTNTFAVADVEPFLCCAAAAQILGMRGFGGWSFLESRILQELKIIRSRQQLPLGRRLDSEVTIDIDAFARGHPPRCQHPTTSFFEGRSPTVPSSLFALLPATLLSALAFGSVPADDATLCIDHRQTIVLSGSPILY